MRIIEARRQIVDDEIVDLEPEPWDDRLYLIGVRIPTASVPIAFHAGNSVD